MKAAASVCSRGQYESMSLDEPSTSVTDCPALHRDEHGELELEENGITSKF